MGGPFISLLFPTRGRPELVQRLFRSIIETANLLDRIEVVMYVDEDDISSHHLDSLGINVTTIIGPKLSMGGYNSICFERASGEIIVLINDDVVIRTLGWDDRVLEIHARFEDEIYLAYSNDLLKKSKFCTFPIISRRTCELLIEPFPVAYQRFFIDLHIFDMFKRLQFQGIKRIFYCDDLIFEHLHYRTGKAPYDETYGYGRKGRFADDQTFIDLIGLRSAAAKRLISEISKKSCMFSDHKTKDKVSSSSIFLAIGFFTRKFLMDNELPYKWRFFLWYNFIGRYLADKGFLWPLVR